MPSLEDLRKKLYGKKEPEERRREPVFAYRQKPRNGPEQFWKGEGLSTLRRARAGVKKSRWLLNLFIFALVIFVGVAAYVGYEIFFVREEVQLTIAGPEGVEIGSRTDFAVFVKNIGRVTASDVELTITYPPHTVLLDGTGTPSQASQERIVLGSLRPGEEGKREFSFRFFGKTGETVTLSALTVYRPENITSRLTKRVEHEVLLTRSPFVIDVDAPDEVSRDQEVEIRVHIDSTAEVPISDAVFRFGYPQGFTFVSAEPKPNRENNFWSLGTLVPGSARTITIRGVIRGEPKEKKTFVAEFGKWYAETNEFVVFLEEAKGPEVASPFLLVQQKVNNKRDGILNPGDHLDVEIFYRNNLSSEVGDAVITVRLSEDVLSMATLRVDGGAYEPGAREIRWNAASLPALKRLAPGAEGRVHFAVGLRPSPPLRSAADKNFSFGSTATFDAGTSLEELRGAALHSEDRVAFQINSRLTLSTRAVYFDSPAANTGPLPPKVGIGTTYTVFWQLANQSNDVTQVVVKGGIPPNVKWVGTVGEFPGTAVFNSASSEVMWSIPRISSATGILRPQATLVFQVLLTPGEDQIGVAPPLVFMVSADGVDAFTNDRLHDEKDRITSELLTDTNRNVEQWRVVP